MNNAVKLLAPFLLLLAHFGCTTTSDKAKSGIQTGYAGFVPARIGVFDCMMWPQAAAFQKLPESNLPKEQINKICSSLNDYVIAGFEDQPFMHGISPKIVNQLLEAKGGKIAARIEKAWARNAGDCDKCENPIDYYRTSIQKRPDWILLLTELSDTLAHADAILIPMISYARSSQYVDRGLDVAEIRAGTALLLINTSNGDLIWASQRESLADTKRLVSDKISGKEPPSLEVLLSRLLTDEMWREFPGKQFLK
jgi:hypothetical protein